MAGMWRCSRQAGQKLKSPPAKIDLGPTRSFRDMQEERCEQALRVIVCSGRTGPLLRRAVGIEIGLSQAICAQAGPGGRRWAPSKGR